jgi:plastocyanin
MRKSTALRAAVLLLVLGLAGCGGDDDGGGGASPATTVGAGIYGIKAGNVDPAAKFVDFLAFYPAEANVHPGDTVRFQNPAPAPHTVTFGIEPDRSNQPSPILTGAKGGANPVVWGPCVSDQAVPVDATACPGAPAGGPPPEGTPPPEVSLPMPLADQAYYNTGVFTGGQTAVIKIAADAKPGAMTFVCLLHPTMIGTLTVVAADQPTQDQAALQKAAAAEFSADQADAKQAPSKVVEKPGQVQAGTVGKQVSVNLFYPPRTDVKAGATLTWVNDSFEPHTVTFGKVLSPEAPEVLGPPNVEPGSAYTGGFAFSGLFGAKPFPSNSFALKFTKPGEYAYTCSIHPGMAGVVEVT